MTTDTERTGDTGTSVSLGERGAETELRLDTVVGGGSDEAAQREQDAFEAGRTAAELRDRAARGDARRKERFRDIVAVCRIGSVMLGFGFTVVLATTYVLHLILPDQAHWLADEPLDEIKSFVVGVVGALLLNQVRKGLDE